MIKKRILGALMSARSLAAVLALAGCSPTPAPTAPTTPPTEPAGRPAPETKGELAVAGPSSDSAGATTAAEDRASKEAAGSDAISPMPRRASPPPPPQGAPPSWLAKAPAPYRAGDAAQYLPKDCKGRVFIDVGGLVGSSASEMRAVFERALKAKGDAKEEARVTRAIAVITDAGADPIATWREIAVCSDGREVVAIGFASDKPLEVPLLVQKVKLALDEDPGGVVREGDMSMLVAPDGEMVAQPAPQVFLVSKDKEVLLAGIKKKAGRPGFAAAAGHLLFAKESEIEATVDQSGDRLDIGFTMHLRGSTADVAKKSPKEFTAKLGDKIKGLADQLKGTPLEPVGERIRAAKFAVRGADVTITGTAQRSSLVSMLKSLGPSEVEGLIKLLK